MQILLLVQTKQTLLRLTKLLHENNIRYLHATSESQAFAKISSQQPIQAVILESNTELHKKTNFLKQLQLATSYAPLILLVSDIKEIYLYPDFFETVHLTEKQRLQSILQNLKKKKSTTSPKPKITKKHFEEIKQLLLKEFGNQITNEYWNICNHAITKRIHTLPIHTPEEYIQYLKYSPYRKIELQRLIQYFTVSESYFFRTPIHFQIIQQKILPELLQNNQHQYIRVWSSACSTGEEAYSLAILLEEERQKYPFQYFLLATDLNFQYLEKAKNGIYSPRQLRNVPEEYRKKYFVYTRNQYRVKDQLKSAVCFEQFNLNSNEKYFQISRQNEFDLILCKNVLIYFTPQKTKEITEKFYRILNNKGYLFLGYSESLLNISHKFTVRSYQNVFYYQKNLEPTPPPHTPPPKPKCKKKSKTQSLLLTPHTQQQLLQLQDKMENFLLFKNNKKDIIKPNPKLLPNPSQLCTPTTTETDKNIQNKIEKANQLFLKGKWQQSLTYYQETIQALTSTTTQPKLLPKLQEALLGTFVILLKHENQKEAQTLLKNLEKSPEQLPLYYYLNGLYHLTQREKDLAKRNFEKSLYLDPTLVPAHFQLAEIYASEKKIKRASIYYQNVLHHLNPNFQLLTFDGILSNKELARICQKNLEALNNPP